MIYRVEQPTDSVRSIVRDILEPLPVNGQAVVTTVIDRSLVKVSHKLLRAHVCQYQTLTGRRFTTRGVKNGSLHIWRVA